MAVWLALSLEIRLVVIAVAGACLGSFANWLIYTCSFFPRPISPWAPAPSDAPPRHPTDRVPIFGWLGLRRESTFHARQPRPPGLAPTTSRFWVRPMLLEIVASGGACALYWWETVQHGLYPAGVGGSAFDVNAQFFAHLILCTLLIAATMIDLDEQTVPDAVTLPGTWAAMLLLALAPSILLPVPLVQGHRIVIDTLFATTRDDWPRSWNDATGLWIGLGCFAAWCYAIAGKTCTLRRGLAKGVGFLFASLWRRNRWIGVPLILLLGEAFIALVWAVGGEAWQGLLSSLLGIAIGGGFIWCIRVVSGVTLGVEAMGFGDVILLGMIGAFLGWQAALLTFFLAPFCAIPINVFQMIIHRKNRIAFGPYLALAAVLVIVFWSSLWPRSAIYFEYAPLLFGVLAAMLLAMGGLLTLWRPIRERLHPSR